MGRRKGRQLNQLEKQLIQGGRKSEWRMEDKEDKGGQGLKGRRPTGRRGHGYVQQQFLFPAQSHSACTKQSQNNPESHQPATAATPSQRDSRSERRPTFLFRVTRKRKEWGAAGSRTSQVGEWGEGSIKGRQVRGEGAWRASVCATRAIGWGGRGSGLR